MIDSQAFADWLNAMTQSGTGDFYAGFFMGLSGGLAVLFMSIFLLLGVHFCTFISGKAFAVWKKIYEDWKRDKNDEGGLN